MTDWNKSPQQDIHGALEDSALNASNGAPRGPGVKDVARRAGVSVGTVSNVINDRKTVRPDIRERVLAAINELGYVPNSTAQALRRGISPLIGVAVLDLRNPFFMEAAAGMERRLSQDGCIMALSSTNSDIDTEARLLRTFANQSPRGLLLTPSDPELTTARELVLRGIPVVLFDCPDTPEDMSSVNVDDRAGAQLAIRHLLNLGHRNIAFLNGPSKVRQAKDRFNGAKGSIEYHNARSNSNATLTLHETSAFTIEAGRATMRSLLQDHNIPFHQGINGASTPNSSLTPHFLPTNFPTAIFCANDLIAFGAMTVLRDAGIRIPEDVSLVGFDDIPLAPQVSVPLTTIRQPMDELGWAAASLLLEARKPGARIRHERFYPTLENRASTAPPRPLRASSSEPTFVAAAWHG
ncbi:MAG: LacI family DNA-binding transcriptional regulator [Actinomycetaceae bacterium]|nr:LacI family DNA-binding transcriptional regulator [Actinomycetaceae bacterium]